MAKLHRTYRLEADTVEAVQAWAESHGMTAGEAVGALLEVALAEPREKSRADQDGARTREEPARNAHIDDMREQLASLREQLAVKDEQIRGLMALADRAQAIADHAQALHARALTAPEEESNLEGAESAEKGADGLTATEEQPRDSLEEKQEQEPARMTWRARLARWIAGE